MISRAATRPESDLRRSRERDGCSRPRRPEERTAGREEEEQRDRDENRADVARDVGHVDAGEQGNESEGAVPERKRVAGVQAAVAELVHDAERREVVEIGELPLPGEMEEPVPRDRPGG